MWHSLSEDTREIITDLRHEYGARLYDYLRTELGPGDAELGVAGALLSACAHAERPTSGEQLRAWLYAVARAHRALAAASATAPAQPSNTLSSSPPGSWPDDFGLPAVLAEALATLPPAQREVLDLAARHGLSHTEIALIFDAGVMEIEALATQAAEHVNAWLAARTSDACPQLTELTQPTPPRALLPSELATISDHIRGCPTCHAAPRPMTTTVLEQMPLQAAPTTLADRLGAAAPLPDDETLWRSDGFPVQTAELPDVSATTMLRSPAPAHPPASPATSAASEPPPQMGGKDEEEFRAWEHRGELAAEFWTPRTDESNPEARISLRPVLPVVRVTATVAAVLTAVVLTGIAWSGMQSPRQTSATAAQAPPSSIPDVITLPADPAEPDPFLQEPPSPDPTSTPPRTTDPTRPTSKPTSRRATKKNSDRPSTKAPATHPASSRPVRNDSPHDPPAQPSKPATKPSASSTTRSAAQLPRPAAPSAKVSPSSISLGSARSGSFSLSVSPGSGRVLSATSSNGIQVSGSRFTVSAPQSKPGCSPSTESGTITLTWSGSNTGDGRTTAGTTDAGGSLSVNVSWTVEADKGIWLSSGPVTNGSRGYWSNCPNG
ncbi:sigma factor-like helix-turn-helix DNA-binding protein [Nonomuraea sp. NPDC023979]|uniref:RNA polymerase sigma factor n=1 Tax=Nonomuraea sp. NPDC023979 TaxID=3154796 RepID=UPI0033E8BD56